MASVDEISNALDQILKRPLPEWSDEQIRLYQVIEQKINHYRKTFIQAQFRQDQKDIKDNIQGQKWYKETESRVKKAVDCFIKQFRIMTFSLTRQPEALRMTLTISLEESNIKLQYFNSHNKFLYYLYLEPIDIEENTDQLQRAYLAKNHPKLSSQEESTDLQSKIPDLENVYKLLGRDLVKIPAGILMKLIAEIILFYEDTETVLKTHISPTTEWSLFDGLSNKR